MKKDKTNLKMIVAIIVSVIISSSITAFAAIKISATEIGYNNTTVAEELDSIYQTMFSNNYSTEEKQVGKWIDGKPLYQRTIRIDNPTFDNTNKQFYVNFSNVQIDTPTAVNAYYAGTADGVLRTLEKHSKISGFGVQRNTSPVPNSFYMQATESGTYSITIFVTFQYTKTTDEPITN